MDKGDTNRQIHLLKRAKNGVKKKYLALANNDRMRLKHFSIASLVFFTSYGMIYHANKNLTPSLEQEVTALASLVVCAISLLWAINLQILFVLKNTGLLKP